MEPALAEKNKEKTTAMDTSTRNSIFSYSK